MKFTYQDVEYDLVEPVTWTTAECIKLETHTGLGVGDLMQQFSLMTPVGIHATVWVSVRRAGLDVAWDDLAAPYIATMDSFRGEPVEGAPDPSTASTGEQTTGKRAPSARARSKKK